MCTHIARLDYMAACMLTFVRESSIRSISTRGYIEGIGKDQNHSVAFRQCSESGRVFADLSTLANMYAVLFSAA